MSARYPTHECGGPLMPQRAVGTFIANYYNEVRLICGRCYRGASGTIAERKSAEAAWAEESAAREAANRVEATK